MIVNELVRQFSFNAERFGARMEMRKADCRIVGSFHIFIIDEENPLLSAHDELLWLRIKFRRSFYLIN